MTVGTIHTPRLATISPSAAVIYLGDYLGPGEKNFLSPACHLNMLKLRGTEDGMNCVESSGKSTHSDLGNKNDGKKDGDVNRGENEEKNENDYENEDDCSSNACTDSCTVSLKSAVSPKECSGAAARKQGTEPTVRKRAGRNEKKYLHLPVGYCDQSTIGLGEICFNTPYKNLRLKMQKTKEKLLHLLSTSNSNNNNNNSIATETEDSTGTGSGYCGGGGDGSGSGSGSGSDELSIGEANTYMKKYIFNMSAKECNAVNSLLAAAHGYVAALCGTLTTDSRAWKEWYVCLLSLFASSHSHCFHYLNALSYFIS
jgi:hypothetical protein